MKQPIVRLLGGIVLVTSLSILSILVVSNNSVAVPNQQPTLYITSSQTDKLKLAHKIGREFNLSETIQAIMLHETQAGEGGNVGNKESPVGKRSYGLMQIQVIAARSVLNDNPELVTKYFNKRITSVVDEEIIALLLTNDEANIRIGTLHLFNYLRISNGNWATAVAGYNEGIGKSLTRKNPEEFGYVMGIVHKMKTVVKSFNQRENLQTTPRS